MILLDYRCAAIIFDSIRSYHFRFWERKSELEVIGLYELVIITEKWPWSWTILGSTAAKKSYQVEVDVLPAPENHPFPVAFAV